MLKKKIIIKINKYIKSNKWEGCYFHKIVFFSYFFFSIKRVSQYKGCNHLKTFDIIIWWRYRQNDDYRHHSTTHSNIKLYCIMAWKLIQNLTIIILCFWFTLYLLLYQEGCLYRKPLSYTVNLFRLKLNQIT